jgi:hypothetical protein
MADKFLGSLVGGGLIKLSPQLDRFDNQSNNGRFLYTEITGIDCTGALTTVIQLDGKWALISGVLLSTASESIVIKLTVDGVVIWNSTFVASTNGVAILAAAGNSTSFEISDLNIICETQLLLEVETITASSVRFIYNARPIA